jgi:phosphoglycerate dehydrogenase-like enzyme
MTSVTGDDPSRPRRLHFATGDTPRSEEGHEIVGELLPAGWIRSDEPDDAAIIIALDTDVDADMIKRAGDPLRVVVTTGRSVDEDAAGAAGVTVLPAAGEPLFSYRVVAEFAVTLMLTLSRNLFALARTMRADPWVPGRDTPTLMGQKDYVYNWTQFAGSGFLAGKTVGIVGLGVIGTRVARLLAPFDVRLLYTKRSRLAAETEAALGVEWRDFDDLLREADVVTLHSKLIEGPGGNVGQFGAREFALMKPTAFLINTARGRIVDTDALVAAIRTGEIAGIAQDAFPYEPMPKDSPLLALAGDNVILTPHIAAGAETEYWTYILNAALAAAG